MRRYKVGDFVTIRSDLTNREVSSGMLIYQGKRARITSFYCNNEGYLLCIDRGYWIWDDLILEDV